MFEVASESNVGGVTASRSILSPVVLQRRASPSVRFMERRTAAHGIC